MSIEVTMPRLSDSMEEGTVAKWLVDVGAEVAKGQVLVEIDTDKATMEYEAEVAGVLLEIVVPEGGIAPIGSPIARIGAPGETAAAGSSPPPTQPPPAPTPAKPAAGASPIARTRGGASPIAKRLARELGVDLDTLTGSGPGGMITKEDVEAAAGGTAESPGVEPLTRVQRAVAKHMEEAAAAPTFAVEVEIDMTACAALRETLDPKPSYNDLVVKACALALRDHPRVNSSYSEAGFRPSARVNVGIAVAADDALYVPVVHDADTKSLAEIGRTSRELAEKARAGALAPADLEGGTFTVSNLGMHGISRFEALLNTPQAAILAVGAVEPRPAVAADGSLTVLPLTSATLVSDHRILYGADAARFLARVKELLEDPKPLA
jgi:pyruvate dehydrogenase E2 component (dihydrolipoamide acetyltransferase)